MHGTERYSDVMGFRKLQQQMTESHEESTNMMMMMMTVEWVLGGDSDS